jgi:isoleucyl-tRNA synthetase
MCLIAAVLMCMYFGAYAPGPCTSVTGFPWCRYVKAADKEIISAIKAMGRLVDNQTFTHSYPFCWRSETPLIYRVTPLA